MLTVRVYFYISQRLVSYICFGDAPNLHRECESTAQNIAILRQSSHLHSGVSDDCERRAWPLQRQLRLTGLGLWQRIHVRRCIFFHFSTLACALFGSLLTGTDYDCEVLHAMGFKKVVGSDYSPQAVSLALVSSSPPSLFFSSVTSVCPNVP